MGRMVIMRKATLPQAGLTFAQVIADNGLAATRPLTTWYTTQGTQYRAPQNGIFAFGLPIDYSWYLGGPQYLGDATRLPTNQWNQVTTWFLCYPEANPYTGYPGLGTTAAGGGTAKSTVVHNVYMRGVKTYLHRTVGGWIAGQTSETTILKPGDYTADQRTLAGVPWAVGGYYPVTTVADATYGSAYYFRGPPAQGNQYFGSAAACVHGWLESRTDFTAGSIDGFFTIFDARVDQVGANMLMAGGVDYWEAGPYGPNTGHNTGPGQTAWIRLPDNGSWRTITCTALPEATLRSDPPPPLVGAS